MLYKHRKHNFGNVFYREFTKLAIDFFKIFKGIFAINVMIFCQNILYVTYNNYFSCRSRYGNIDKRKGNAMLMKKLQGKNKQYFDSGDYNMAKNKPKLNVPNPISEKTPTPGTVYFITFTNVRDASILVARTSISVAHHCAWNNASILNMLIILVPRQLSEDHTQPKRRDSPSKEQKVVSPPQRRTSQVKTT